MCVCIAELMRVLVWVTAAGTVDEGGVEQPAYLNFDTTLLAAPLGNEMSVSVHPSNFPSHLPLFPVQQDLCDHMCMAAAWLFAAWVVCVLLLPHETGDLAPPSAD